MYSDSVMTSQCDFRGTVPLHGVMLRGDHCKPIITLML